MAEYTFAWEGDISLEEVGRRCAAAGIEPMVKILHRGLMPGDIFKIENVGNTRFCIKRRATDEEVAIFSRVIGGAVRPWPVYVVWGD